MYLAILFNFTFNLSSTPPTSKEPDDTELLTNFLQEDIKNIELKIHTIF